MQPDSSVFQPDVLQLRPVLEEPPIRNIDLYGAGIEDGVVPLILYEHAIQHHFVEKGEVYVFDPDGGIQLAGQAMGYF